jgi:hypothetical protein
MLEDTHARRTYIFPGVTDQRISGITNSEKSRKTLR